MSTPTQKTPKSKTRKRRSHLKLTPVAVRVDKDGTPHLSHKATKFGKYKGKQVTKTTEVRIKRAIRNNKSS